MEQIITLLKDVLEPTANEYRTGDGEQAVLVAVSPAMYEDWPTLEFPDLTKSIFDLFSRPTSESVSSALLSELTRSISDEDDQLSIRLQTDDQLRWCMQVLNYSLTLSFTTHREFETVRGAVRIYLHWLRALTDFPDGNIPTPLVDTPEKYFRSIIDALRNLFCRRIDIKGEVPRGLAIERQAREVETVLDAVRDLTLTASRKYQNEVWARTLSFLLNSADLLLADPLFPEEMGMRVGSRVVDTLFDLWFHAVLNEEIPSPTYWRTLAALCRRWRHHVTVIESWARKLLAMTVLVCRKMYGEDYCKIAIHDESITPFAFLPPVEEDGEVDLLYHSWFNLFCLLDSPADILSHDLMQNKPIMNPAYIPWVDEKGPKAERILDLTMEWLLAATRAKSEHKAKAEVTDDVISSLSLHSLDLDDVPEAMIAGGANKRRSIASSTSSTTGDSLKGGEAGSGVFSGIGTGGVSDGIDGVSAGRSAAIAALTRIICSKRTNEKLPNQQLARFLSTVHEALIEKDRLVLCSLFFYGQNLFRLGLPGLEAILPHYLFALDIILIESNKIRASRKCKPEIVGCYLPAATFQSL
ncbi:hypothetical protein TELCIR_04485 [Teladorsagia circumcincta]|uniref:Ral GTPase-activating protein subunit alpha/beta N-terminal domain-containing protein n=1 Tax=Teladorsagia circumcincta TaxID=45464 RepID=A0A2G9UTH7_TELCI|nr:hypothetical protein TELCIR_04485 [Teladorsagia circumcincta]